MKIFVWTVSILLSLIVAGLAFVYFSPGYGLYFVRSESMKPTINMGDVVVVGPAGAGSIRPGDIVTYESGNNLITHRVLSIDGDTLITKADASEDADPRPVQLSRIESRYLFKIPYAGYLTGFVRTRPGWFLAIILPAAALVGLIVKDIVKEALKNENHARNTLKAQKIKQGITQPGKSLNKRRIE